VPILDRYVAHLEPNDVSESRDNFESSSYVRGVGRKRKSTNGIGFGFGLERFLRNLREVLSVDGQQRREDSIEGTGDRKGKGTEVGDIRRQEEEIRARLELILVRVLRGSDEVFATSEIRNGEL
jgi:hypothetical protein